MKCKYLYRTGDKLVILGKKTIGEDCRSNGATDENGGYCPGHARQMDTMSAEKVAASNRKGKALHTKYRQKRRDKKAEIGKEIIDLCKTGTDGRLKLSPDVLDAMGLTSQCDLEYEYKAFMALNPNPGVENWNEKMAFARWLETPAHLRVPKDMGEAAAILGVSFRALAMWKTSPDIINFINADMESRMGGLYKLAIYAMGEGIVRGDKGFTEVFIKHYNDKKETNKGRGKVLENVPKEMQKEADEYGALIKQQNMGAARKSEKTLLNDNYFGNTLKPGSETEQ